MLMWKNPNMGKTTATHGLQNITMRGLQRWGTETTISCSLASPTGSNNRGNELFLSLSLMLSVHSYSQDKTYITLQQPLINYSNKFALRHIYIHMTFRLFTHIVRNSTKTEKELILKEGLVLLLGTVLR